MNISDCDSKFFPDYDVQIPSKAQPLDIVVTSLPTAVTFVLWILFEGRRSNVHFTRNMIALSRLTCLIGSVAQGFLTWRVFEIFDCESLFKNPMSWVAIPLAALGSIHVVAILSLSSRFPRTCALFALLLAGTFAFGEYAGRNIQQTSAVKLLVPFQQIYCIFVVCFLTGVQKRGNVVADRKTVSEKNKRLKAIDPLQRRREDGGGEEETRKWSWWS